MEGFQEWFSNKLAIRKFPTVEEILSGSFDNFQYRINTSDIFRPEIDAAFKQLGVESFWCPQGEAFGMSLASLFGSMRIMWQTEKSNQYLLLHCHAGKNRSVMVADSYYFLKTGEHPKNSRLKLNINDGQFPGIYKMEEFLDCCRETFDDAFAEKERPLDWVKNQVHMKGSGFC